MTKIVSNKFVNLVTPEADVIQKHLSNKQAPSFPRKFEENEKKKKKLQILMITLHCREKETLSQANIISAQCYQTLKAFCNAIDE